LNLSSVSKHYLLWWNTRLFSWRSSCICESSYTGPLYCYANSINFQDKYPQAALTEAPRTFFTIHREPINPHRQSRRPEFT